MTNTKAITEQEPSRRPPAVPAHLFLQHTLLHQFGDQPVELLLCAQQGGYGHGHSSHGPNRGFFFFNLGHIDQVKANHAFNQSHVGDAIGVNCLHMDLSEC